MKWLLGIAALYLLTRNNSQPVATPAGGMNPAVSLGGSFGVTVNQATGTPTIVADPLPTTVQFNMPNANTFGVDPSDEAFANVPLPIPTLPATKGIFLMPSTSSAPSPIPAVGMQPTNLSLWANVFSSPGVYTWSLTSNPSVSYMGDAVGRNLGNLTAPGGPASITASPLPLVAAQIPGTMQPLSPQQVPTTPLGVAALTSPTNPTTGRILLGAPGV